MCKFRVLVFANNVSGLGMDDDGIGSNTTCFGLVVSPFFLMQTM